MMKRRMIQGLLILALLCGAVLLAHPTAAWADVTATAPTQGDGSASNPYQISNAGELYWFAGLVNDGDGDACAVLTDNITINEKVLGDNGALNGDGSNFTKWTPIGDGSKPYTGTFDGAGHTISGLYIDSDVKYAGLFGYIGTNGTVKNLALADSSINSSRSSGDYAYVGGICGKNDGSIENCSNSGTVTGNADNINVGGICGLNWGSITSCSNSGTVTCSGSNVGGICGVNSSIISNCSNSGTVTGSDGSTVGGICGYNWGSITNCSNSGTVTGSGSNVGGICGYKSSEGSITACYWLKLEGSASAGVGGGSGGGEATEKNAERYATGEVAWLLNGESTNGPWRQNLTGTNRDAFPTLDQTHHIVIGKSNTYTNEHNYQNGFCTSCGSYESATQDDAGTYQISNAGQLYWFAELVNDGETTANAVLTRDITINENVLVDGNLNSDQTVVSNFTKWTPIGGELNQYTGTFDGAGHTISGLYFNDNSADYVGLFGAIGRGGMVKDLTLADSFITGANYVGGICGYSDGSITTCSNSGSISVTGSGSVYVGGICGQNWGTITNCCNSGSVAYTGSGLGSKYVGGICGWNNGSITTSSNSGAVSGSDSYVGGICGYNSFEGSITNCSNSGKVVSNGNTSDVGGICGWNNGRIENCSNNGTVAGGSYVGGICGWNDGRIENCSNSGDVSGSGFNSKVGGICGWNNGSITTSSNSGAVSGSDSYVGGICGHNSFEGSITNCYWLSGTAGAGIGDDSVSGEAFDKTGDEYKSGKVAWLLNQWQTDGPWRQNLGEGGDSVPILDSTHKVVVQLIFNANTGNTADNRYQYANSGDTVTVPEAPTRSGYTFGGWYDNEALSGDPVTAISADATGDQTYWAKWTAKQTPPPTIPPTVSEETIDAIGDAEPGETVTVDLSSGSTKLDT